MVKGDLFGHIYCRDTYYAIMIQLHLFFGKAKAIFGSKVAGEPKAMSRPSPATNIDHRRLLHAARSRLAKRSGVTSRARGMSAV
jgi:hypothetical protein